MRRGPNLAPTHSSENAHCERAGHVAEKEIAATEMTATTAGDTRIGTWTQSWSYQPRGSLERDSAARTSRGSDAGRV